MTIAELLLAELETEATVTRPFLERVPAGLETWQPHEKSMALGRLAAHIAELPSWAVETIERSELDIAPVDGPAFNPLVSTNARELLEIFDKNVERAKQAIAGASDAHLLAPWALVIAGHRMWELPRYRVVANNMLNHLVHHRAQLGVYLRLNGVPVPPSYGPSADERGR